MSQPQLDFTVSGLFAAAIATLRQPKEMARAVISMGFPNEFLWMALTAIVTASVVIGQGSLLILAGPEAANNPFLANPGLMCLIQMVLLVVMVFATHHIGRLFGGNGSLLGALAIVTWLQFVLACLQLVQTVLLFVAPPLADLLGIFGLIVFIWLFTNFVAALHGFQSLGVVFMMIFASAFALTFVLSIVLSLIGISAPGVLNV